MWRSAWQPYLRSKALIGPCGRIVKTSTSVTQLLAGQAGSTAGGTSAAPAPNTAVREARDTLELIDELLWSLGPADSAEPGFVFFDLDETLITRDTCLIDGLCSTSALVARLEAKLGPSSETLRVIRSEMEREYYSAELRLVDPLLARVIRALKVQGHSVFGLTSNALDTVHAPQILAILAKYKIRFSAPKVRGELPRTGAITVDHPVSRGIIFGDNHQAITHDKGEIIAEYVGLLLHNARRAAAEQVGIDVTRGGPPDAETKGGVMILGSGDVSSDVSGDKSDIGSGDNDTDGGVGNVGGGSLEARRVAGPLTPSPGPRKCVLVDNTSRKCERAMASFARHAATAGGGLELQAIHYTEADNLVDSPEALRQLRALLARLRARGIIGVDLVAEDILVTEAREVRRRGVHKAKAPAAPALVAFEPGGEGGRGGRSSGGGGVRKKHI